MLMKPTDLDRLHQTRSPDGWTTSLTTTPSPPGLDRGQYAPRLPGPRGRPTARHPTTRAWRPASAPTRESAKRCPADDRDSLSPGAAEVRDRFAVDFQHTLFDRPDLRKRWTLRHRSKESVAEVADRLAWSVGANLDQIVPTESLGTPCGLR
ncbi:hypothetical protein GXW82_43630 [Streptacidiphilus sp. 4-A2]|nr:hypothetical protein [Streptacidiphilus sp. 4-A2]